MSASATILRLVNIILWFIGGLLGLRILLKFFGANPATPFVDWVYETSAPLLAPFVGIFPNPSLEGGFVIEISALFALIIYAIIGSVLEDFIARLEANAEERTTRRKK